MSTFALETRLARLELSFEELEKFHEQNLSKDSDSYHLT
jgi:hypothetical protein